MLKSEKDIFFGILKGVGWWHTAGE